MKWFRRQQPAASSKVERVGQALEYCAHCNEPFVYPLAWEEHGPSAWLMHLRCAVCGDERKRIVDNKTAEEYDKALDLADWQMFNASQNLTDETIDSWLASDKR